MKQCSECERLLDSTMFYKSKGNKDGTSGYCKECHAEKHRIWRANNRSARRSSNSACYWRNRDKRIEHQKKFYAENRSRIIEQNIKRPSWKRKACSDVNNFLRRNDIAIPLYCQICKTQGRVDAHHEDYSRPLDVIFICRHCHSLIHAGHIECSSF